MDLNILEQRVRAFDSLFDAVVVTNMEGIITDWNIGAEGLYGYTKEEAIGQSACIVHVPDDVQRVAELIISSVEEVGKWNGEIRFLHKDSHIGWIESMCVPIFDENNQMIGVLGMHRDITTRIKETKRLHDRAHYDELTQLPNRYLLLDRLKQLIERSECEKNMFTLFYIDLDNFKTINDTKGHAFGDKLLKEAASRLSRSIRNSDTIARIGGDEFILLLENSSTPDDISKIAKTLIKEVSAPYNIEGTEFQIGCSIGIVIYPENGTNIDTLLLNADIRMYKAKHKERGTYHF